MKKLKENQNVITTREKVVGKTSLGVPVIWTLKIETTMTHVFVYHGNRFIGAAGVVRAKDFDFKTLYKLALRNCAKYIIKEVA